jgi:hypothetical protein
VRRGDEHEIDATFFRSRTQPQGLRVRLEARRFVADAWPHNGPKDELPLVSFATYRGDKRALANVQSVTAIAFDVDDPMSSCDALSDRLANAIALEWSFCTSFSSVLGALKFRVLAPISRPMLADEHRIVWPVLADVLARAGVIVDPACKDASRAYFVPAIPPSGIFEARTLPGERLDVAAWLDAARELAEAAEAERAAEAAKLARRGPRRASGGPSGFDRACAYVATVPAAIQGQNGSDRTIGLCVRLVRGFELSDEEALAALAPWNASCRPPWKPKDLARKVAEARKNGRMAFGELLGRDQRRTA